MKNSNSLQASSEFSHTTQLLNDDYNSLNKQNKPYNHIAVASSNERARDALNFLSSDCTREKWVRIGMAIKSAGLSFEDFHNWSTSASNYAGEKDCLTVWKSFIEFGGVTPATLFGMAKSNGWEDASKSCANTNNPKLPVAQSSKASRISTKVTASTNAAQVWKRCIPATNAEPYIYRKKGKPDGLRVYPASAPPLTIGGQNMVGYLVVPCWQDEYLQTLQFIHPESGKKLNLPSASFNDGYFIVGKITDIVYVIEGIGQAWAINSATGKAAVVCFGAGRVLRVAKALRQKYPSIRLIIVPDRGKEIQARDIASTVTGQYVAMPADKPSNYDANDYLLEFGADALAMLLIDYKATASIARFALNGYAQEMRKTMLEDKFVLDNIALLGQATVIYAKPNIGKTLLVIWMLIDSIKASRIDARNIYYVNADDNYKGLLTKLEIAEQYGFQMLAPSHNGFESNLLIGCMKDMSARNEARGVVIILDTLKKFTDLMDKKVGSDFMACVREFVSKGGTVIMLAHVNKHRDGLGKVITGGTSDVVDDSDCAFTLDAIESPATLTKTVLFENIKSRGVVASELAFTYSTKAKSYEELINSVKSVNKTDTEQVKKAKLLAIKLNKDKPVIDAIIEAMDLGHNLKTQLLDFAHKSSGISKPKLIKVLDEYTGNALSDSCLWRVTVGVKNANIYHALSAHHATATDYNFAKNGD